MYKANKALVPYLLLTFNITIASAKGANEVSATVKDNRSKEPVEFASVDLLTANDSTLTTCITDSKGYFQLNPPEKATKARIRYLGYKTLETPINDGDLGTLYMEEDPKYLKEFVVTGKSKLNNIDGDVYIVTKELRSGAVSTQELIGKLNGVSYNRYDNSIAVNGSTKVLILIDGIEKDQDMVKNYPSDRIERIEVIKDPVGKYATDGYTAVINVILKKDYSGIDAFLNSITFLDFAGSNGGDIFVQELGNYNVTYSYKKLNVYATGNLRSGNFNIPVTFVKKYGNITTETAPPDYDNPNSLFTQHNRKINIGSDYTFNKNHLISAEFRYSSNNESQVSENSLINKVGQIVTGSSYSESKTRSHSGNWQGTVTYKGKFDEKNSLDADARYSYNNGYNYSLYSEEPFLSETNIENYGNYSRLNINYYHQFSPAAQLNLGYGNVYSKSTNSLQTANFNQTVYRNRFSIYLNYKPVQKISTKLGGTVENYIQKNNSNSANQTAFLPYVNIQYTANNNLNLVAKYHSRSIYPDISQLSTFKTAQDSLLWSAGNPLLKTGMNNSFSLDINYKDFITLTPYYSFDNTGISNYICTDPENNKHYLSQYVNADHYNQLGASLNFTIPFCKNFFWQNGLDWNHNKIAYKDDAFSFNDFTINSSLFYTNKKAGLTAGTILQKGQSRDINIQGYSAYGSNMMVALLQKSFLKEKLNVSLLYMMPVNFLKYDQQTLTKAGSYYQLSTMHMGLIKNLTFIQVTYRFKYGKTITPKTTTDDNDSKSSKKGGFGM